MSNYKVCSCGFLFVDHYKVNEENLRKKKIKDLGGEEHLVDMFGGIKDICYCKHIGKKWFQDGAYTNKCKKMYKQSKISQCSHH